jgi:predicted dehydrogenase
MLIPRILIVGLGSIGERHLRCAQRIQRAELAICDINNDLRRTISERYNIQHVYADFDAALTARPDLAVICVPANLHILLATRLVESGIHVLIEKPLSTSLDGVDQLRQAVLRRNVIAAVAYVLRTNPNLIAMRAALHSGRFGRPVQLVAVAGQNFPFYRPAYRNTYYKDRAQGGGAVQDALTHFINAAEWLIGPVDRVVADEAHCVIPDVEVEDTVHVLARHQDILASYALNQHQAPNETTMTIVCERGTLRCEFHENRFRWMDQPGSEWHDDPGPKLERDDFFVTQLTAFLDAVERGEKPLCTLDEGIQTLQVNLAIQRSVETKSWSSTTTVTL